MPKKIYKELILRAKKMYPGNKERQDQYVFGTIRKIEAQENKKKGRK